MAPQSQWVKNPRQKYPPPNRETSRHWASSHPLYRRWRNMLVSCYDPDHWTYELCGAKGVSVHPDLQTFNSFIEMVVEPEGKRLVRIDKGGDFEPENIKWVKSKGTGSRKDLRKLARRHCLDVQTLVRRRELGNELDQPRISAKASVVEYRGVMMPIAEAARKAGLKIGTARNRRYRGIPFDQPLRRIGASGSANV